MDDSATQAELTQLREELQIVKALARRIHRDLCQSLEDYPDYHPLLSLMKSRADGFARLLEDTPDYLHGLHRTIEALRLENEALRRELRELRGDGA